MLSWNAHDLRMAWRNPRLQLIALFAFVLASRFPFLDAGYGANVDAWRVARAARDIGTTGEYTVSRFPGYPVQEIVCSWIWRGGPVALNGLTALFSAVSVVAFAMIARKLQFHNWLLAAVALAATPIFFVSSVCSKDYIWALAFVLLSLLGALHNRPVLCGILLGLATGCRITSLAMGLPLALILFEQPTGRDRLRALLQFSVAAAIVAILAFSPVWLHYGTSFFTFYENHARPDWATVARRGLIDVWGVAGLVGLGIGAIGFSLRRTRTLPANKWVVPALLLAIVVYICAYLRLPDQAGYLLPIVPAVLLLWQQFASRRTFQVVAACLLIAPFVEVSNHGFSPGAIVADHKERIETMARIVGFLAYAEKLPGHNTIVVGAWEPQIAVMLPQVFHGRNCYAYLLTGSDAAVALRRGDGIFYVPTIREFNYRVYGIDLVNYGARDLHALFLHEQAERAGPD